MNGLRLTQGSGLTGHEGVVYDLEQLPELFPQDAQLLSRPRKKRHRSAAEPSHRRPSGTTFGTDNRSHFRPVERVRIPSRILVLLVENPQTSCVSRWQKRLDSLSLHLPKSRRHLGYRSSDASSVRFLHIFVIVVLFKSQTRD